MSGLNFESHAMRHLPHLMQMPILLSKLSFSETNEIDFTYFVTGVSSEFTEMPLICPLTIIRPRCLTNPPHCFAIESNEVPMQTFKSAFA